MKKILVILLNAALVFGLLSGCTNTPDTPRIVRDTETEEDVIPEKAEPKDTEGEWKDPSKPSDDESTSEISDWKDPGQEWKDPSKPSDGESTSETSDWKDPGQEWKDPNKPAESDEESVTDEANETEAVVTEASTELTELGTGEYRHQIGDFVFYTEHDINDYIGFADGFKQFYASKMVTDIFGTEEMYVGNGEINAAIDFNGERKLVGLEYGIYNDNNELVGTREEGNWFGFELDYVGYVMLLRHLREPEGALYTIDEKIRFVDYDIILLSLYMCENARNWQGHNYAFLNAVDELYSAGYYIWDISAGGVQ